MVRPRRLTLLLAALLVGCAILPASALAGAVTDYVAPNGSGAVCSQQSPCSLTKAVEEAVNEDRVSLAPGTYPLPAGGLGLSKEIDIGGQVGAAGSTLIETNGGSVHSGAGAGPTLHDMHIEGTGGLILNSGIAERLFVSYTGPASAGCSLGVGTVMRDSVCWSHDDGESGADAINSSASGTIGTVVLRNVTALATNSDGDGIRAQATGSLTKILVEGTDVIARGTTHPDVAVELNGGGFPVAEVKLADSSFAKVEGELPPFGTVTSPGTDGNQTAAPVFADPANGDFHEAVASTTLDAGAATVDELKTETKTGPVMRLDLEGRARVQAKCLGATAVIDIGAFEAAPVDCSPPLPPDNKFRFGELKLNKKKGTATLIAIVPGSGTLELTGKGLKSVARGALAAGSVRLPIALVGKARKGLAKRGERKVSPVVTFTPTGGSPYSLTHSTSLHEKAR